MRVITGTARGKALTTLPGEDIVRPTSQRVKEGLFSAIQFEIAGRTALDAFAGSGQLGIEAMSRGAVSCLFLESDARAMQILRQNLEHCSMAEQSKCLQVDALQYLRHTAERFDLIFLDPPYGGDLLEQAIPLAAQLLTPGGLLACEANLRQSLPQQCGSVSLRRDYRHGKTKVYVYQNNSEQ